MVSYCRSEVIGTDGPIVSWLEFLRMVILQVLSTRGTKEFSVNERIFLTYVRVVGEEIVHCLIRKTKFMIYHLRRKLGG